MNKNQKYGGIILWMIILIILVLWGLNYWTEYKIRSFLDEKVEEGTLEYESFNFNILTNNGSILSPLLHITSGQKSKKIEASQLSISQFSLFQYLIHHNINLGTVKLIKPKISLIPHENITSQSNNSKKKFDWATKISIKNLKLEQGSFQSYEDNSDSTSFYFALDHLSVKNLSLDSTIISNPFGVHYENYSMEIDSLYYKISDLYQLAFCKLNSENGQIAIDSLQIKPRYGKRQFMEVVPFQKTWVDLSIPFTEFINADWTLNKDSIELSADAVRIDTAELHLYKDNRLEEYPYTKPMYSKLIRELPLKLDIDSIHLVDAALTFQLQTRQEPPPGLVYFDGINGKIAHLSNVGMNQPDFPRTTIVADALFMKESNVHLNWDFDIDNQMDEFQVLGTLSRISQQGINYFLTPALNVSAEGAIDRLAFNFAGNNEMATGDMYIDYDKLKINLLKKDGTKRSPWISAVFNFLLKNNLDGPIEKKGIEVERIQSKSFWNYLWQMVKKGSLKSIT